MNETKTYLVEIKPSKQTRMPIKQGKRKEMYLQEMTTYGINQAKWRAADAYARDRGWEFIVLTEDHLFNG